MKLLAEFDKALKLYEEKYPTQKVQNHKDYLRTCKSVHNIDTRLAHDMIHGIYGSSGLCELYNKYNCNDSHISTLAMKLYSEYLKKHTIN